MVFQASHVGCWTAGFLLEWAGPDTSSCPFSHPLLLLVAFWGMCPLGKRVILTAVSTAQELYIGTGWSNSLECGQSVLTSIVSWPVPRKFSKLLRRGGIQSSKTVSNERAVRKGTGSPRPGKRTPKAGVSRHDTECRD